MPSIFSTDVTLLDIDLIVRDSRIGNEFKLPSYAKIGDAGLDILACIDEPVSILPGATVLIDSGISVWIKNPNCVGLLVPRSGLGHKQGVILGNSVGVIDSGYQGPLSVSTLNRNHDKVITINPGDRIAQLLLVPIFKAQLNIVEEFFNVTDRGTGSFGHTGVSV